MNLTDQITSPGDMTFVFNSIDYAVFIVMLCISALIGVYFGFCGKGANTTDEYLLGGKKMKTIPIAISLVASQLSGIAIMAIPAEIYAFGSQYAVSIPTMFVVIPLLCYVVIPVFYNNNISNCYEYLELRFDKKTRRIVTVAFLVTIYLISPVIIFIPSLAFSQVTGVNIHIINGIVSCVCVFYTMLGGIKAVVWTDVVQAIIMVSSCVLVATLGTSKIGGFNEVLSRADEGGRLIFFNLNMDVTSRTTFWNCFFGGIFTWSGYIGLNQSCVQRIVSLPSLRHARKALWMFAFGFFIIMSLNVYTGVVMYARYYLCDPVKIGIVEKPDKLMPYFVQDVIGHLKGMPGIFISCVFSAALSTMSANLNSLSGVIYFDYIRPFINHTEAKANFIMKIIVVATGAYAVLAGVIVEKSTSILQVAITISGMSKGAVLGCFTLGLLYPKANAKAAFYATLSSLLIVAWIILRTQIAVGNGDFKYEHLPTRTDECDVYNVTLSENILNSTFINSTVLKSQEEEFSIYKISFHWYGIIGTLLVWLIGIPLSHLIGNDDKKMINSNLISPAARFLIPKELRHIEVSQNDDFIKEMELKEINKE